LLDNWNTFIFFTVIAILAASVTSLSSTSTKAVCTFVGEALNLGKHQPTQPAHLAFLAVWGCSLCGMDNDLETLLNSTLEEFPEKDVENQEFLKQFSQNIQIQESVKGTIDSIRSEKDQPQEENIDSLLDNLSSLMDNGELDSLLTNVMDQIVSKDLLYEPMKDLASKYPEFLLKSKNTVQQEEYSRFEEQFRIVNEIISVYDNENDAVKVLKLMQDVILNLLN
jgi:hypothetical protein